MTRPFAALGLALLLALTNGCGAVETHAAAVDALQQLAESNAVREKQRRDLSILIAALDAARKENAELKKALENAREAYRRKKERESQ